MLYVCIICMSRYDHGMVAQALAAGLQTTLKEYAVLVSKSSGHASYVTNQID